MNPPNPETPPENKKNPLDKLLFIGKIFFMGFLILVMNLPMGMIESLIYERNQRLESANQEVSSTWGKEQTLGGPVLTVPYLVYTKDSKNVVHTSTEYAHFLPETLNVVGKVDPEIRYRGIYKILLYRVDLNFQGSFPRPDFSAWHIPEKDVLWDDAFLSVGIPDMRAIQESVKVSWGDSSSEFGPGEAGRGIFTSGIQVPIRGLKQGKTGDTYPYAFDLKLAGSKSLDFLPFGKQTQVTLHSTWNNPSFGGAYLPTTRDISEKGFSATWKVLQLGRNYPQQWLDGVVKAENYNPSAFGVDLLFPVESYQMNTRSAKYGILFILLTFVTFFFFEIFSKLRIHPVQYLLVGFALCLFYLLLLSLSEYLEFGRSYLVASLATISIITGYSSKVLHNGKRALVMGFVLGGLYAYLYTLVQLQDFSLLMGSVGLFIILAAIMFITRKVDWYSVGRAVPAASKTINLEATQTL
ncbi:MAG: cell envelope integrity protein CreD [bacterium]